MRVFYTFLLLCCINKAFTSEYENINTQFIPIFKQIVRFHEFLQDPVTDDDVIDQTNVPVAQKEYLKKFLSEEKNAILKSAEFYLQKGANVLYGKETVESLLEYVLKERLDYLIRRTQLAIKRIVYDANNMSFDPDHIFLLPSDPHLASFYLAEGDDIQNKANKVNVEKTVTEYQFANLICSSLYKIIPRDKLSHKTVNLLRSSPQLWPLLRGETYDLGNPDEAGGFAIVKAYLGKGYLSSDSLRKVAIRIDQNVRCLLWEEIKPSIDAELYKSNFITTQLEKSFVEFKGLGCRKGEGFWTSESTAFERGEEVIQLTYPDFLKMKSMHQESITIEPSFFDLFPFEKLDVDEKNNESLLSCSTNIDNPSTTVNTQCNSTYDQIKIDETEIITDVLPSAKTIEQTHYAQQAPKLAPIFTMPAGIRKFHDLMPHTPYPVKQLDPQPQNFVDTIFDSRRFQIINFKEFKTFWEQQGGTIKNNHGGSHRLLIGPNGDSLFGTFAHNNAHTYTHKTIKYLQAALWYTGCRPGNDALSK